MDSQKQLDLGSWVGLQKAFANVSSGCSAARGLDRFRALSRDFEAK